MWATAQLPKTGRALQPSTLGNPTGRASCTFPSHTAGCLPLRQRPEGVSTRRSGVFPSVVPFPTLTLISAQETWALTTPPCDPLPRSFSQPY